MLHYIGEGFAIFFGAMLAFIAFKVAWAVFFAVLYLLIGTGYVIVYHSARAIRKAERRVTKI